MDGGTGPGAEVLSPGEAEWPPELRLPPLPSVPEPPGPPPPAPASASLRLRSVGVAPHLHGEVFDDDPQFLGSIMGAAAPPPPQQQQQQPAAAAPVKRKRGRPPKNRDGAAPVPAPVKPGNKKDEEEVCFICFDGGSLVVCDRRCVCVSVRARARD
jgi:hypothetical protein